MPELEQNKKKVSPQMQAILDSAWDRSLDVSDINQKRNSLKPNGFRLTTDPNLFAGIQKDKKDRINDKGAIIKVYKNSSNAFEHHEMNHIAYKKIK